MTQQIINIGAAANDGKGDSLRSAGIKVNANFAELYSTKVPDFFGNANKILSTNGTSLFWVPSTITNAIQTTSVYNDPVWIGTLAYSKLTGKPTIPTAVSQLNNDLGFITTNGLPSQSSNSGKYLTTNGTSLSWVAVNPGSGTVTQVSFTNGNGFSGTVSTSTTTPAISIGTSITGILKGDGTSILAASAGTDYLASLPTASTSTLGGVKVDGTSVTINGSGVISVSAGLAGSVVFKGGWNASTNSPTLVSGTGSAGWMYIVTIGGTQNLGGGTATYAAGDLLVYDGTNWIDVAANNGVVSFNTRTGAVTLTSADITSALGYTPYNSTNPNNYLTSITSSQVTTALGFTPLQTTSLSVTTASASGSGSLTYSGNIFTFTPPAAYSLPTATPTVLGGVKIDNSTITISNGVIAVSNALTSAVQFKGSWDASTNTPGLSASSPTGVAAGWEYIVSASGTRDLGNGSVAYSIGDLVIYDGSKWVRIPGGNSVTTFNTRQGAITLTSSDVTTALGGTQVANKIFAGPATGVDATPTFRSLVAEDIPSLTSAQLATIVSDETGSGKVVFGTSPAITTSLTTPSTSFDLINTTAATVNFAGAGTTISIGANSGTITVGNPTVVGTQATVNLWNSVSTTVNAFSASTTTKIGASGTIQLGQSASTTTTVQVGGAFDGNTLKVAGTGAGTINLTTDVTSGTVNIFTSATGTIKIGTTGSGIVGFAAPATSTSTAASLGYLGMPQQSKSSAYTTVVSDAGKHIYVTATATITIDSNANVPYPIGTSIAFIAAAGATVTIAITSDTMYLGGTGTTGSRTLAAYGMATAVKVTSTSWFINGTGLT